MGKRPRPEQPSEPGRRGETVLPLRGKNRPYHSLQQEASAPAGLTWPTESGCLLIAFPGALIGSRVELERGEQRFPDGKGNAAVPFTLALIPSCSSASRLRWIANPGRWLQAAATRFTLESIVADGRGPLGCGSLRPGWEPSTGCFADLPQFDTKGWSLMCSRRLTLLILIGWPVAVAAEERPNIILVMADDQGWGDMAYQGHPVLQTPNFDAAAEAGLRFNRFYAAAPVCSPTRGSVMTGRHPNRYGVHRWGHPIRPQETTIAHALRTAGYTTGHFGKWHLGSVRRNSPVHPGAMGFEEWISAPNFYDNDPILSHRGTAVPFHGESSIVTVEAALEWITQVQETDQPFLAVIWFGSPHTPHRAVDQDREPYRDLPLRLQHFYGEITGMDRAFGKLRDALSTLGIRENTLLWYCSDNGALREIGSTGGHRGHKGNIYEGGLLVPAILEWPARISAPRQTDVRGNTSDIYPTVLEIAGVQIDHQPVLDGISLVPLIDGDLTERSQPMGFWDYPRGGIGTPSAQWMGELLAAQQDGGDLEPHVSSLRAAQLPDPPHPLEHFPGHAAWIDGDWKLHRIEPRDGRVRWELYDLVSDPAEETNLAEQQPERVAQLRPALEAWFESVLRSYNGEDYAAP